MYKEFKLINSEYAGDKLELYSNGTLFVNVNFHWDTISIAKCIGFDRWSNAEIIRCDVPYTADEYGKFEKLLCSLTELANGKPNNNNPHKKLTFV